jgi:transposase
MSIRAIKQYSTAFRRQVVQEYERGASIESLRRKYGIGGKETIPRWIQKYGTQGLRHNLVRIQTPEEVDRVRELEAQVRELQEALGKVTLEKLALESTLEVLEEEYGVEAKKNAASSSGACSPKRKSKPRSS